MTPYSIMDELLKKKEEIRLNIKKYQQKIFSLQNDLINIEKGISGIRNTSVPLTHFVCPSTLK